MYTYMTYAHIYIHRLFFRQRCVGVHIYIHRYLIAHFPSKRQRERDAGRESWREGGRKDV